MAYCKFVLVALACLNFCKIGGAADSMALRGSTTIKSPPNQSAATRGPEMKKGELEDELLEEEEDEADLVPAERLLQDSCDWTSPVIDGAVTTFTCSESGGVCDYQKCAASHQSCCTSGASCQDMRDDQPFGVCKPPSDCDGTSFDPSTQKCTDKCGVISSSQTCSETCGVMTSGDYCCSSNKKSYSSSSYKVGSGGTGGAKGGLAYVDWNPDVTHCGASLWCTSQCADDTSKCHTSLQTGCAAEN